MKKKITVILLILALVAMSALALWARQEPKSEPLPTVAATAAPPVPITAPTVPPPTEPDWQLGIVRAGPAEVVYTQFCKGDTLEVTGAFQEYYVVSDGDVDLLIEKRFLRTVDEAPFESWTGFAQSSTAVYASALLDGDVVATLGLNQAVTVAEGKGDWLFITWDAGEGYVHAEHLGTAPVSTYSGGGGASSSNSGDSAPAQDGTDVDVGSLGADGIRGGIVLLGHYDGPQAESCPEAGPALVLADQIPGYILLLSRGDAVKVIEAGDQQATIWLDAGRTATLPRWLLRLDGDEDPAVQTLYSASGAAVCSDYRLQSILDILAINTPVEVLEALPTCYVVSIENEISYMSLDQLSATPYPTGGGGGGASSSGSSGNTGSSGASDTDVWTPPAM